MGISKKRIKEIKSIRDDDIDYTDIPELDEKFFANAEVNLPKAKKVISLRVDNDVLQWFKSCGAGYQTRMNAVLKTFMQAQKKKNDY